MKALAAVTAFAVALATLPIQPAVAQQAQALEDVRDQGILYFKKERFKQAKTELDKAYRMTGGDKDFQTIYYRGRVAYSLLMLEVAFTMADQALALAGEDARKKKLVEEWTQEMTGLFGGVTIKTAEGETNTEGRVFLEAKTGIINKEKKQAFLSIRERFRTTDVQVPTTIYLPYGEYLANNVPFSLVQGEPAPTVEIFLQVVQKEDEEPTSPWVYIGAAGAAALAAGVGAFLLLSEDETRTVQQTRVNLQNLMVRP